MATTQVKNFDDGGLTDSYSPDYNPYAVIGGSEFGDTTTFDNATPIGATTYQTGITPPAGVYPDPNSRTGYSDSKGDPVEYNASGNTFTGSNGTNLGGGSNTFTPDLGFLASLNKALGTNLTAGDLTKMGIGAGALAGLAGLNKPNITKVGYQGGIPQLQANRTMMTAPPAGHVPGAGGINYGGDVVYSPKSTAAPAPGGSYTPSELPVADKPYEFTGRFSPMYDPSPFYKNKTANMGQVAAQAAAQTQPVQAAQGGLMGLAHGGRYLQGNTDGMADKLRTSIDGKQPAALSHGEFVIPADVVSHLGNGNSDAGAKKLYSMMDKIREARTGTKKQGKQINPDKFMPGGLAAAYASGGEVRGFATGDVVPAGTTGIEQGLSSYVGPYVTDMLSQGQALANAPYQQYTGQLTAGPSDLQNQAFNTATDLTTPSSIGTAANTAGTISSKAQGMTYAPQTTSFDSTQAQQYMNPYLQASLNPQLDEARRQSEITAQQNNAAMTKAGAFGGGRQAILTAENQRNLGTNLANITGQGYNTAYTNAMSQFNADQARKMQENQFGANYGLQGLQTGLQAAQAQGNLGATQNQTELANLNAQAGLGATQAGITQAGLTADKAAFTEARDNPYKMLQFQQSLLNGLPISATNYTSANPSGLTSAAAGATTVDTLLNTLGLGSSAPVAAVKKP